MWIGICEEEAVQERREREWEVEEKNVSGVGGGENWKMIGGGWAEEEVTVESDG
jgi:hypothetical protein